MQTHNPLDLSIITINYNGYVDTCEMVDSVMKHIHNVSYELIIVDNASQNSEALLLQQRYPNIIVIPSEQNLGFAGGNNLGLRQAQGKYILLLNNDTYIKDESIIRMIELMKQNPQIGMVSPLIKYAQDKHTIQYAGFTPLSPITLRNSGVGCGDPDNGQYASAYRTAFAHGAAMLFKKDLLQIIGYMPEIYFLYYEEMDWCTHLSKKGYEIWVEPRCVVYHKESASTGQNSPLKAFYMTRNRLLYAKRNLDIVPRVLSYLYQLSVVVPKDCIKYSINKRKDLAKATWQGAKAFITLK